MPDKSLRRAKPRRVIDQGKFHVLEDRLREQLRNVALLDRSRELVAIAAEVQAQSVEICEHSRETIIRVRLSANQRARPPA